MFLSEFGKIEKRAGAVSPATVTVSGGDFAVYTDSEKRDIAVISPMGYIWKPEVGHDIFVIKADTGTSCILGASQRPEDGMSPGDIMIKNQSGDSIVLKRSGGISIKGNVTVSGTLYASGGVSGGA